MATKIEIEQAINEEKEFFSNKIKELCEDMPKFTDILINDQDQFEGFMGATVGYFSSPSPGQVYKYWAVCHEFEFMLYMHLTNSGHHYELESSDWYDEAEYILKQYDNGELSAEEYRKIDQKYLINSSYLLRKNFIEACTQQYRSQYLMGMVLSTIWNDIDYCSVSVR